MTAILCYRNTQLQCVKRTPEKSLLKTSVFQQVPCCIAFPLALHETFCHPLNHLCLSAFVFYGLLPFEY